MTPMHIALTLAALAAPAAACIPPDARPSHLEPIPVVELVPDTADGADTCGAAQIVPLIGQEPGALDSIDRDGPMRVIPVDGMVTMDFLPHRVNVRLDADGRIDTVDCG